MEKSRSAGIEERRRFWEYHLGQCRTSGLSQAEYCRRHGLSVRSFGYRKRTIAKAPLTFVEVPLAAPVHCPPNPLTLAVGPRYTIRIEPGFDADTLRRVLDVLGQ